MFVGNAEFIAHERHKDLLLEAERRRLIKTLREQRTNEWRGPRSITTWLGVKLVSWGLRLQGQPPQLTASTVTNGDCLCP